MLQLAKHNPAQIWLAARTASKADAAIDEVKKLVPAARITHLSLDLTSFDSIAKAAETFQAGSDRLDTGSSPVSGIHSSSSWLPLA